MSGWEKHSNIFQKVHEISREFRCTVYTSEWSSWQACHGVGFPGSRLAIGEERCTSTIGQCPWHKRSRHRAVEILGVATLIEDAVEFKPQPIRAWRLAQLCYKLDKLDKLGPAPKSTKSSLCSWRIGNAPICNPKTPDHLLKWYYTQEMKTKVGKTPIANKIQHNALANASHWCDSKHFVMPSTFSFLLGLQASQAASQLKEMSG